MAFAAALIALFTLGHAPDFARAATLRAARGNQAGMSSAQQTVFFMHERSKQHETSLTSMMGNMTVEAATDILRSHTSPQAQTVLATLAHSQNLQDSLQVTGGLSGVETAKTLLNTMLEEVQEKYDLEVDRCCDFAQAQSNLIEESSQDIAFFNGEAAEAREHILSASQGIDMAKVKIPKLKIELDEHNEKCKKDLDENNAELKLVLADISVMSMVLGMTDCNKGKAAATQTLLLLSCDCDGESVVTFYDEELASATRSLASHTAQQLLQEALTQSSHADLDADQDPNLNGTLTTPVPAEVEEPPTMITRSSPCKGPKATDPRTSKCSVSNNPQCQKLQERFLLIQSDTKDRRDELQEFIGNLEKNCKETRDLYEAQLEDLDLKKKDFETKLAAATEFLNSATEQSRLKSKEFEEFKTQWAKETETCHKNYADFESQECGLKKIRTELFKMQRGSTTPFFQDCVVSEWEAEECSKSCETGTMVVYRSIVSPTNNGMKCPPLSKSKPCNTQKCAIDCKVADWEGWSSCSADCGGGTKERTRQVLVKPRYRGNGCAATSEAVVCHSFACEADCELSDWSAWGECSKMCGGGSMVRVKAIKEPATGGGKCAPYDSELRRESKQCNEKPCLPKLSTLRCESEIDVVLLLDGSGSIGQQGWDATKKIGVGLANAFHAHHADIQLATMLFSGPRTWGEIDNCGGDAPPFTWKGMYAKGYLGTINEDKASFNALFHAAHLGIVRRRCMWCTNTHREIYYRRYTEPAKFDAYQNLLVTWTDSGMHTDFDIFSNLADALRGTNAWQACNGNDRNIGFPRDCGPTRLRGWQWESLSRGGQRHIKWEALTKFELDMEKDCNIKFVNHFSNDTAAIVKGIENMEWPRGATLTAQALAAAEEELPNSGRPEAQSVVVVITDGRPISSRKTYVAAHNLQKKARLLWVPVSYFAPRTEIKQWASTPVDENVVDAKTFSDLVNPTTINTIISDVCHEVS